MGWDVNHHEQAKKKQPAFGRTLPNHLGDVQVSFLKKNSHLP